MDHDKYGPCLKIFHDKYVGIFEIVHIHPYSTYSRIPGRLYIQENDKATRQKRI